MWARKRLDIGWTDVVVGFLRNLLPGNAARRAARLESRLPDPARALACLSVRTGFDLLWQAQALPAGDEVIFSAVTIHDMPRIAAEHGLVPVPADLDLTTLAPNLDALAAALTPRTRALVVAHLFGTRLDLTPYVAFARAHGLLLIEDCAQAWAGPGFTGDARADVSMFSFGTIKSATAMGGAVLYVRRPELLARMRELHAAYPPASRAWFARRLIKNSFMMAVSLRPWYGLFVGLCRLAGQDYDRVVNGSVRGFPGPEFLARIRKRPPTALAALLDRRLTGYNRARLDRRTQLGRRLLERLGPGAPCPGAAQPAHNFWVFSVQSADPAALIRRIFTAGFDATQGQSLCAIEPPAGREALAPENGRRLLREVVFLPLYPALTDRALERLAAAVLAALPAATPDASVAPVVVGTPAASAAAARELQSVAH
ncbi:MAG: DegT/DnrJ/EryC1/StrS family aminotransferase [Planctomycetota bacterium]